MSTMLFFNREDFSSESGEEEAGYASWTNAELSDELSRRGLPTSGNKAELVARLEEDDAS